MWFCEHHFNTYRQGNTATFTYTSHGIEHAHTCAPRDDCPTSQFPKLPKLQLRLAELPRLPLQDHEKGVLRVTQSSTHWLENAVSTDAPEAADILRCESSRCHSRVVLLAHTFEKPFTVGHTLNHRLLANMDARCAPCASTCLIMACLMFRASMPTTMSFSYPSKALQWCSSWLSESSDTSGCRNSFEVHAYKDVDLCATIEPSDRAHRNDDTSNKKKSVHQDVSMSTT